MLHIIVAPYHLGERSTAVGAGPLRVIETGVASRLQAQTTEVEAGNRRDWMDLNHLIADLVRDAIHADALPLVLAGNCNSCLGTLEGIRDLQPGIVWFDAHADFHTPETSISGSIEGMALTLATSLFVPERSVVLAGARDLDPGEDERVLQRLCYIPNAALENQPLPNMSAVYVHIDVDVLDPAISPGANFQGPGGLTVACLVQALKFTFERYNVAAVGLVNYNPQLDPANRTRDIVVEIMEVIGKLHQAGRTQ